MRLIAAILCIPFLALAHGSGASLEARFNDYLIDVGVEPARLKAGERAVFDFSLSKDGTPVPFERVWVRLVANDTVLATHISPPAVGPTTAVIRIPADTAALSMEVRYGAKETIAEAQFEIPVAPEKKQLNPRMLGVLIAGILIGGGVWYLKGRWGW